MCEYCNSVLTHLALPQLSSDVAESGLTSKMGYTVLLSERQGSKILYPYYKIFYYLPSGKQYPYLLTGILAGSFILIQEEKICFLLD